MLFVPFSNKNVEFAELRKLTKKFYITGETLPTIYWVKLIDKREFAIAILDKNFETYVIYDANLGMILIHASRAS